MQLKVGHFLNIYFGFAFFMVMDFGSVELGNSFLFIFFFLHVAVISTCALGLSLRMEIIVYRAVDCSIQVVNPWSALLNLVKRWFQHKFGITIILRKL